MNLATYSAAAGLPGDFRKRIRPVGCGVMGSRRRLALDHAVSFSSSTKLLCATANLGATTDHTAPYGADPLVESSRQ